MYHFMRRAWNWFWATNTILNYPLGRLIELRGNYITVDGVRLYLHDTGIPTKRKFRLLFDYEYAERRLLKRYLNTNLPVVELGGFIGGLACITNKMLEQPKHHIVVEANPDIVPLLEHNRAINQAKFTVVPAAIAYNVDQIAIAPEGMASHIAADERNAESLIRTLTLQKIIETYQFGPITLICDIEGYEIALVENEIDLLRLHVHTLIIEVHPDYAGADAVETVLSHLKAAGFVTLDQVGLVYILRNAAIN
jgi:FkbM family methyltransferase